MLKTFRRRSKPAVTLAFSAIILATIPFAIYSLLTNSNFDSRQFASEDWNNPTLCTINIPYINTKTLEVGKKYQAHVYTNIHNEEIKSVKIFNKDNQPLLTKKYKPTVQNISEVFTFSPSKLGPDELFGEVQTTSKLYPCKMDITQSVLSVITKNHPPEFLTDPYFSASPPSNSVKKGDSYEYTVEIEDIDKDQIEYHYSFTPRANWLHKTVLESGENGKLRIKFAGNPDVEGSYLANIFIHDGYNRHLSAQSWVINIGKETSQIPVRQEPKLTSTKSEIENKIILQEPQISKLLPNENSIVTKTNQIISANLVASKDATIKSESIKIKLNDDDITTKSEIITISEREALIRYIPEPTLPDGVYKISIYFEDSNNLDIEKEWVFNIEIPEEEGLLFGIPINTIMVFVIGIILVAFAFSIPWILFIAWKKDESGEYEEIPILKPR